MDYNRNDNNPYYGNGPYQKPYVEPGSNFANISMVLGIISIVSSFTFTIYPAFVLGSMAIVLALLSRGRRRRLANKAGTGIICGTIGLITNTIILVSCMVLLFTNNDIRNEVNKTFEEQYGTSFDEMWDEIMEDSGL